jgi:methionine-rich copper-binding protein CopC
MMKHVKKAGTVLLLLLAGLMPVLGQALETPGGTKHFHLAPETLPFKGLAINGVPVASLQVNEDNGTTTGQNAFIGEVVIAVGGSSPHGITAANIAAARLYKAKGGGAQTWDFTTYPAGLTDISGTVALDDLNDEITFTINDANAVVEEDSTDVTLYVVIDYASTVDTETNVVYQFQSISYGAAQGATTFTLDSGTTPALRGLDNGIVTSTDIYDYEATFGGAGVSGSTVEEGDEGVAVLRIDLGGGDQAANKDLKSITFRQSGSATSATSVPQTGVKLYYDADDSGDFNIVNDSEISIAGPWVGNDITLNIPDTIAYATADAELENDIGAGQESFFLVVNIADPAEVGETIRFEILDESTDIEFYDSIDDNIEGTTAGIGFTTYEYDQSGYITTTAGLASAVITINPKTVIDTTPPTIIASTPADAAPDVSRNLATVTLTFDDVLFDDSGGGDPASVTTLANYAMEDSLAAAVTLTGVAFNSGTRTATLTIDGAELPLTYSETYTVTVSNVENTDGYAMTSDSVSFTIEVETPPEVTDTTPNDGAPLVARDATVEIVFSEAMNLGTLIAANFSMKDGAAVVVPGTFGTTGNRTITFAPDSDLDYATTYTVELVSANILDAEGSTLADWVGVTHPYSFSFTTLPNAPPTVLASVPADGTIDASIGTAISLVFSEPMDETAIVDDENFSLFEDGRATEVPGTLSYNTEANTLTFTPDEMLNYSTGYTGTVTTGVTDADGAPISEDYVFSFFSFTTVSAAEGLSFTDIIVANNQILPGSSEPMRIFIETPAGAASTDVVTIAVYTSSGRRVATLTTTGETYADVIARQPIVWDGSNDRGQSLGSGLYFIQISSEGSERVRRALRVRIVR